MTLPFLPFWPPRSPARQCDANSDQTKDHRRAVGLQKRHLDAWVFSCLRGTKRPSESYFAPIVAHNCPATGGTEEPMMSRRAAMTSQTISSGAKL